MKEKHILNILIIPYLIFLSFDIIAQPYYFYSEPISLDSSKIYKVDLNNGEKQLFLSNIRQPFDFVWDNYQKWFFLSNISGIYIYNCEDPLEATDFIPPRDYDIGVTVFSVPSKNYLYLSWFERFENELYTTQNTTLLDFNSLQLIKECSPTIDGRSIISNDRNFIYQFGVDSLGATFIDKYSIDLDSIIDIKYFSEISTNESLHFNNGREGEILFSLDEIMGDMNSQKYFVYDIDNNIYHPQISFPSRSYGYLTPNAEYIILQKALWAPEKPTAEDITGEISIYYTTTGELVSNLTLPPEGKILIFNSYPNKFFYYVPETEQAITINITELEQNSGLPVKQ